VLLRKEPRPRAGAIKGQCQQDEQRATLGGGGLASGATSGWSWGCTGRAEASSGVDGLCVRET
jgi:hypothetical protein